MAEDEERRPESLLPYEQWTEEALRQVVARALAHVAKHGLPGEHHFYISFRTDHPGTIMPARLRAQYPQVMTIVLQHQFWDLAVDEAACAFSVGLSFGGVPATLTVPLAAITGFADPYIRFGLQFRAEPSAEEPPPPAEPQPSAPAPDEPEESEEEAPQVVSLDAFRRRTPPKT